MAIDPAHTGAAMALTHDMLIARAGHRRRSGVYWEVYGPVEAWAAAAAHRGGRRRVDHVPATTEGLIRLRGLLDTPGRGWSGDDQGDLATMAEVAASHPRAVLVIAFCAVDPGEEAT